MAATQALAAAGRLDSTFSGDGKRTFGFPDSSSSAAFDVAVDGNGRIAVAGVTESSSNPSVVGVARLKSNGNLDDSFSSDGKRPFAFPDGKSDARALAIDQEGRVVVAGTFYPDSLGPQLVAVARLKPNGDLDHSFSGDGRRTFGFPGNGDATAGDVAIDRSDMIVVVGRSGQGGANGDFAVARLRSNGTFDPNFSGNGKLTFGFANSSQDDSAAGVAVDGEGRIVLAGYSQQSGTGTDFAVARVKPGGGLDHGFSGDGRLTVNLAANGATDDSGADVAIDRNGRILVAGSADRDLTTGNDFALIRVKPGGGLDDAFSGDGRLTIDHTGNIDRGRALALDRSGRIVVAGSSDNGATGVDFAVARVRPGGGLDNAFSGDGFKKFGFANGNGANEAHGVTIDLNGRIVLAGRSDQGMPGTVFAVARLLGT